MARNLELRRMVSRLTWGAVETLTGLILYSTAMGVSAVTTTGGKSSSTAKRVMSEADRFSDQLFTVFNPGQLRAAWSHLKRRGLVTYLKGKKFEARATKLGLEKLNDDIARYQEVRLWDRRVYLISYDIEEEEKSLREKLRKFLLEIKCVPLHRSLFLSINNPRGLLKTWVKDYFRSGEILVSDLGPDGTLGDRPLEELVADVYRLRIINAEYADFLSKYSASTSHKSSLRLESLFYYQSILEQDPQLPFELLPDWWLGDRAWRRYKKIIGETTFK